MQIWRQLLGLQIVSVLPSPAPTLQIPPTDNFLPTIAIGEKTGPVTEAPPPVPAETKAAIHEEVRKEQAGDANRTPSAATAEAPKVKTEKECKCPDIILS